VSLLPLQLPPQESVFVHEPCPVAGWPLVSRVQVPLLPGRLQALHCSGQAVLQHTPSAQELEEHSGAAEPAGAEQAVPLDFLGTQLVPLQYEPLAHEVDVQLPAQLLLSLEHKFVASQCVAVAAGQVPFPSQYSAGVSIAVAGSQLEGLQRTDVVG
jgi:hypothetical protein